MAQQQKQQQDQQKAQEVRQTTVAQLTASPQVSTPAVSDTTPGPDTTPAPAAPAAIIAAAGSRSEAPWPHRNPSRPAAMDSDRRAIGIGLMGLGVVGSGVARILRQKADVYERQIGRPLVIQRVLVRDPAKKRDFPIDPALVTTRAEDLLDDPEIELIIEVMGGERPAYDYLREALQANKFVVTANKEVMAKHGGAAGVGARAQRRSAVRGERRRRHPDHRAAEARPAGERHRQRDGDHQRHDELHPHVDEQRRRELRRSARRGPSAGLCRAGPDERRRGHRRGVQALHPRDARVPHGRASGRRVPRRHHALGERDFTYARELGYAIKLLAIGRKEGERVQLRVHPTMVPADQLLANVDGALNAVEIEGDLMSRVLFQGPGAGSLPTTSAVVADALDAAVSISNNVYWPYSSRHEAGLSVMPTEDVSTRYYLRIGVADEPGVLARTAGALSERAISIASVIQKEVDGQDTAEIVIMTHDAREADLQRALQDIRKLDGVAGVDQVLRVKP